MEYELTKDCQYGNKGKIVNFGIYLRATSEERRTLFREVPTVTSRSAGYNSSESHHYDNDNLSWASNNSPDSPSRDDSFAFGGGSFGGGGASGDYDNSGYGSSDSSSYDSGSSDSGSSDCGDSSD